jgi:hypothetical protein
MNVHPIKELSSEIPTEEVVSTQSIPTQTPPESAENKDSFNGTEGKGHMVIYVLSLRQLQMIFDIALHIRTIN